MPLPTTSSPPSHHIPILPHNIDLPTLIVKRREHFDAVLRRWVGSGDEGSIPCRTITFENFRSFHVPSHDFTLGKLHFNPVARATSYQQLLDYYGGVLELPIPPQYQTPPQQVNQNNAGAPVAPKKDDSAAASNPLNKRQLKLQQKQQRKQKSQQQQQQKVPSPQKEEEYPRLYQLTQSEILTRFGSDPSPVLTLGATFWIYSFGREPQPYPLERYMNYMDHPGYRGIVGALRFREKILDV
ncbi:hypothetical protein HK102_010432, partial [Quaeritorhiza haematococci]